MNFWILAAVFDIKGINMCIALVVSNARPKAKILPGLNLFRSCSLTERAMLEVVYVEVRGTHQGQENMAVT